MADAWDQFPDAAPSGQPHDPWAAFPDADGGQTANVARADASGSVADRAIKSALTPITSYPDEFREKRTQAEDTFKGGVERFIRGGSQPFSVNGLEMSVPNAVLGPAQAALGGLGYVTSPISAAVTSLIGKPVEKNTGIPHQYVDFAAEAALPGVGMGRLPAALERSAEVRAMELARQGTNRAAGPVADRTAAFDRSNVTPSVPAVTENRGAGAAAKYIGDTVVGGPVSRATGNQFREAGTQAERIADSVSDVGDKALAGERIQAGAQRFRETEAPARQGELYDRARDLIDADATSPLNSSRRAIAGVQAAIRDPGVREFAADPNFTHLVDTIRAAGSRGLTFNDLRELRTQVRLLRPAEGTRVGINRGAIDRVYQGLTDDMTELARTAGGNEAANAIRRADQYTRALEATRAPALARVLEGRSGEEVFAHIERLAGSGSAADWRRLASIRHSVSPQEWNDLSATVIRNLGTPKAGQRLPGDAGFSPSEFVTNYGKMSEQGRGILFADADLRRALNDLAEVSGHLKRVERLGNPSGTARAATAGAAVTGLVTAPVHTVLAAIGGYGAAHLLSQPRYVRWLTAVERASRAANQAAIAYQARRIPAVAAGDTEAARELSAVIGGLSPAHAEGDDQPAPRPR